jgi:hypothetical protein
MTPGMSSREMRAQDRAGNDLMAEVEAAVRSIPVAANPTRVRRTQRIVRERAMRMQDGRARLKFTVWVCALCSVLLGIAAVPVWNELDDFAHWSGVPDLQIHMLFLGMWFLPATITALLLWRGWRKQVGMTAGRR